MPGYSAPAARDWVITLGVVATACAAVVALGRRFGATHPLVFLTCAAALLVLLVRWHAARSAYRCPNCSAEFRLSAWQDFFSPNLVTTKYARCPQCGKRDAMEVLTKTA